MISKSDLGDSGAIRNKTQNFTNSSCTSISILPSSSSNLGLKLLLQSLHQFLLLLLFQLWVIITFMSEHCFSWSWSFRVLHFCCDTVLKFSLYLYQISISAVTIILVFINFEFGYTQVLGLDLNAFCHDFPHISEQKSVRGVLVAHNGIMSLNW